MYLGIFCFLGFFGDLPEPGGHFGLFEPWGPPKLYELLTPSQPGGSFDVKGSQKSKVQESSKKSLDKKVSQKLNLMRNYANISDCAKLLELKSEFLACGKNAMTPTQMFEAHNHIKSCRSKAGKDATKEILQRLVEWFPESVEGKISIALLNAR